jgi:hypothetical protein
MAHVSANTKGYSASWEPGKGANVFRLSPTPEDAPGLFAQAVGSTSESIRPTQTHRVRTACKRSGVRIPVAPQMPTEFRTLRCYGRLPDADGGNVSKKMSQAMAEVVTGQVHQFGFADIVGGVLATTDLTT